MSRPAARTWVVPEDIYDMILELAELKGTDNPVDECVSILREELPKKIRNIKLQATCPHPLVHHDRKSGFWCHTCGKHLPDYVCEHENKSSYKNGGWYCNDCKEILA